VGTRRPDLFEDSAVGRLHAEAMIEAVVARRFRERLLLKPRQFLNVLCHELPHKMDPRRAVSLEGAVKTTAQVVSFLKSLTKARTAVYLGAWSGYEIGEYPLPQAVAMVEQSGGAIASVEAGELAYYKTEVCSGAHGLNCDRFVLVKDPDRRTRTQGIVEALRQRRG
jgi:hypothetical protein